MTYDEALEDHEPCSYGTAQRALAQHYARIIQSAPGREAGSLRIQVTNDCDDAEWIDCTPAAICAWLGY